MTMVSYYECGVLESWGFVQCAQGARNRKNHGGKTTVGQPAATLASASLKVTMAVLYKCKKNGLVTDWYRRRANLNTGDIRSACDSPVLNGLSDDY